MTTTVKNNINSNGIRKEDLKHSISLNGHQPKVLYQPQQQEKLAKLNHSNNSSTVLAQQNSNIQSNASTNVLQTQQSQTIANQPLPPLNQRLNTGPFLNNSVKLLDENFNWQDQFQDVCLIIIL